MSDVNAPAALAVDLVQTHDRQISRFGVLGVPPCPADWERGKSRGPCDSGPLRPIDGAERCWMIGHGIGGGPRDLLSSLSALSSAIRLATDGGSGEAHRGAPAPPGLGRRAASLARITTATPAGGRDLLL